MTFPGATPDREGAAYVLVGAPLDASTSFRPGTRFGPRRVREFAEPFDDYDRHTGLHFSDLDVHDRGDVETWHDVPDYLDYLEGVLEGVRRDDAVPLLVGGEHTVSVAGIEALDPDVFVCLDAHLDLREDLAGEAWSHATVTRRALETVEEAVILGARTGSETEWERAQEEDVTVVPPEGVAEWTPDFGNRKVYLSVDVDAADPGFAPGTGTPEPFGLDPRTMRDVVREVAPRATGFDLVEVNDRDDGQAASLGAKLLRAFVYEHAAANDR